MFERGVGKEFGNEIAGQRWGGIGHELAGQFFHLLDVMDGRCISLLLVGGIEETRQFFEDGHKMPSEEAQESDLPAADAFDGDLLISETLFRGGFSGNDTIHLSSEFCLFASEAKDSGVEAAQLPVFNKCRCLLNEFLDRFLVLPDGCGEGVGLEMGMLLGAGIKFDHIFHQHVPACTEDGFPDDLEVGGKTWMGRFECVMVDILDGLLVECGQLFDDGAEVIDGHVRGGRKTCCREGTFHKCVVSSQQVIELEQGSDIGGYVSGEVDTGNGKCACGRESLKPLEVRSGKTHGEDVPSLEIEGREVPGILDREPFLGLKMFWCERDRVPGAVVDLILKSVLGNPPIVTSLADDADDVGT